MVFKKGQTAWNKGIPKTESEKKKQSETRIRLFKEGKLIHAFLGKKFSDEHRKNLSISHKGQKSFWKGKHFSKEHKEKIIKNLIMDGRFGFKKGYTQKNKGKTWEEYYGNEELRKYTYVGQYAYADGEAKVQGEF